MRRGSAPSTMRCATRWASVLVLPEPAPAMTSSGRVGRMLGGAPLVRIEGGEMGGHVGRINRLRASRSSKYDSWFVRNR